MKSIEIFSAKHFKVSKSIIETIEKYFKIKKGGDFVICFGGNGTLIRAIEKFNKPILPIKINREKSLSFNSDINLENLELALEEIKNNNFYLKEFNFLEANLNKKLIYAINEFVIFRSGHNRIYLSCYDEEEKILEFGGDGCIVTSSFGSTAYNFYANGALTKEKILILTPLNSNFKSSFATKSYLKIFLEKGFGKVEFDGKVYSNIKAGDYLEVKLSSKSFKIIKIKSLKEEFYKKIKRALYF